MQAPLLITTNQGFICVDEEMQRAYLIDGGKGTYYGITYSENNIYVAARRISYVTGKDNMEEQEGVILVFDYALNLIDELYAPFKLRDLHQLYYFNKALWIVCTYDCMIATYRDGKWEQWYPLGADAGAAKMQPQHINSIYYSDNVIYLGGSINRVGMIYAYHENNKALFERHYAGYSSHNVWREDGDLYTLSSMSGTCITTGGRVEIVSRGNFVRGVVATRDEKYFGISESLSRTSRENSSCMIKRVATPGRDVRYIGIRDYGQINEIRSPGRQDFAHPSASCKSIDTAGFGARFPAITLSHGPCIPEMPVWYWRLRYCFQSFDTKRRRHRLLAKQLI